MTGFFVASLEGKKHVFYIDEFDRQIEVEPTAWDKRRPDGVYDLDWNPVRLKAQDAFNEADHPRDPKGTTTGGQFTSKNATAAPSKPKGPPTDQLLQKETKGKSSERVALRKALKTETDPMKKDALRKKIMESFKLEYDKTGNATLLAKIDKYGKLYGLHNYSPPLKSEVALPKPTGKIVPGPYSPEEIRTYELLNKFDSTNAKTWMRFAKDKKAAGDELGLTFEELAYAQTYTGSGYRQVNGQLRQGTIDDATYEYATRFDRVLDKLPVHRQTTYRGTDLSKTQSDKYQVGKVVVEAAFTSTSKDKKFQNKGDWGFIVKGKTGRDISSVSKYPHEQEILFKKNTAFRVTKREERVIGGTIYLEEVEF